MSSDDDVLLTTGCPNAGPTKDEQIFSLKQIAADAERDVMDAMVGEQLTELRTLNAKANITITEDALEFARMEERAEKAEAERDSLKAVIVECKSRPMQFAFARHALLGEGPSTLLAAHDAAVKAPLLTEIQRLEAADSVGLASASGSW